MIPPIMRRSLISRIRSTGIGQEIRLERWNNGTAWYRVVVAWMASELVQRAGTDWYQILTCNNENRRFYKMENCEEIKKSIPNTRLLFCQ